MTAPRSAPVLRNGRPMREIRIQAEIKPLALLIPIVAVVAAIVLVFSVASHGGSGYPERRQPTLTPSTSPARGPVP